MFVEIVPRIGGKPLRLEASQIVVRNNEGTPIVVAGEFGPNGVKVAHAADADFNQTLRAFGYDRQTVETRTVRSAPPPAGATLVGGPEN